MTAVTIISRNKVADGQAPLPRVSSMRREVLLLAYLNPSCCGPVTQEEELACGRSQPSSVTHHRARQTKGHGLLSPLHVRARPPPQWSQECGCGLGVREVVASRQAALCPSGFGATHPETRY